MPLHRRLIKSSSSFFLFLMIASFMAGCDMSSQPAPSAPPPPTVGVIEAQPELVKVTAELSGRLEAWRIAEVRARVAGIIQSKLFSEGSEVKADQALFQIDATPYKNAVRQAEANLALANAKLLKARAQSERILSLGKAKVVSELDQINADASLKGAEAEVEAARAALSSTHIDLEYAEVHAPISGRIGRSLVTEGALVGQNEATHLATIQQIHPIYASFSQSAMAALNLRSAYVNKMVELNSDDHSLPVQLLLENGSEYSHPGRLLFGELAVERSTGQIQFRAVFPNPESVLLPGMYVKVVVEQAQYPDAFLIPQQAVTRSEQGDIVMVISSDDHVVSRQVTIAGSRGNHWIITKGLTAGDKVMVDGFFKVRPGAKVTPVVVDLSSPVALR